MKVCSDHSTTEKKTSCRNDWTLKMIVCSLRVCRHFWQQLYMLPVNLLCLETSSLFANETTVSVKEWQEVQTQAPQLDVWQALHRTGLSAALGKKEKKKFLTWQVSLSIKGLSFRQPPDWCCPQTWRRAGPSGRPAVAGSLTPAPQGLWPPAPKFPDGTK